MEKLVFIYVPFPDEESAVSCARAVVEEGLAACANILEAKKSVYIWQGELQADNEHIAIFKTTQSVAPNAAGRIRELHPYTVPCIAAISALDVNKEYLDWVIGSVDRRQR